MAGMWEKFKETAFKAGLAASKDPKMLKTAMTIKETVDAFKAGYREQMDPEKNKLICPHCQAERPKKANYCPQCGARLT